jgi:hypothetical protein
MEGNNNKHAVTFEEKERKKKKKTHPKTGESKTEETKHQKQNQEPLPRPSWNSLLDSAPYTYGGDDFKTHTLTAAGPVPRDLEIAFRASVTTSQAQTTLTVFSEALSFLAITGRIERKHLPDALIIADHTGVHDRVFIIGRIAGVAGIVSSEHVWMAHLPLRTGTKVHYLPVQASPLLAKKQGVNEHNCKSARTYLSEKSAPWNSADHKDQTQYAVLSDYRPLLPEVTLDTSPTEAKEKKMTKWAVGRIEFFCGHVYGDPELFINHVSRLCVFKRKPAHGFLLRERSVLRRIYDVDDGKVIDVHIGGLVCFVYWQRGDEKAPDFDAWAKMQREVLVAVEDRQKKTVEQSTDTIVDQTDWSTAACMPDGGADAVKSGHFLSFTIDKEGTEPYKGFVKKVRDMKETVTVLSK